MTCDRPFPLRRASLGALCAVLAVLALGGLRATHAEEGVRMLQAATGLQVDGALTEAFWKGAEVATQREVRVVAPDGPAQAVWDLRVAVADQRLVVGVEVAEDPGTAMGLHLFLAPEDARTAAEALSIDFRPVELRAPRLAIRGPKGVGRTHYRVEAAADWQQVGRWRAELAVPLADLGVGSAPFRLAVVTYTRTPNVLHAWPQNARWTAPAAWAALQVQGAAPASVQVDAARMAREDEADARRQAAWLRFLKGMGTPVAPTAPPEDVAAGLEAALFAPLAQVLDDRPDLLAPVQCLRGDLLLRLGRFDQAQAAYEQVLGAAPGWREAAYGLHVKLARRGFGRPGDATDYAGWRTRLETARAADGLADIVAEGLDLRLALLDYFEGRFAEARPVLERLAARHPHDAFLSAHAGFARKGKGLAAAERMRAEKKRARALPRARLETSKGPVVFELLEDDAPNTVNNFVYLAQKKFYDGVAIHRTVPMFLVQTGDGLSVSRDPDARARIGTGTAGYAIRSEQGDHALIRGMVAMANAGRDTESSQFFLTTGTAIHLQGDQTVFGRVLEGQAVLESLTEADRIDTVTVQGLDPERRYHPTDASGRAAPEPAAR